MSGNRRRSAKRAKSATSTKRRLLTENDVTALLFAAREFPNNTDKLGVTARTFRVDEGPGPAWLYVPIGEKGRTRFMAAAAMGNLDRLRYMLDTFAKSPESKKRAIEMQAANGSTPLMFASQGGHVEVVRYLLNPQEGATWGADVNVRRPDGATALYFSTNFSDAKENRAACAQILIAAGADVDAGTDWSPLLLASKHDNLGVVEALIAAGATIDFQSEDQVTSLELASWFGNAEVAKVLIAAGADVNHADIGGATPLYRASKFGSAEIVLALTAEGANVNVQDNRGLTPIYIASTSSTNNIDVLHALIAAGAQVNTETHEGFTALIGASDKGNYDVVRILLEHGATMDSSRPEAHTALYWAAKKDKQRTLSLLLEFINDERFVRRDTTHGTPRRQAAAVAGAILEARGVAANETIRRILDEFVENKRGGTRKRRKYKSGTRRRRI